MEARRSENIDVLPITEERWGKEVAEQMVTLVKCRGVGCQGASVGYASEG